MELPVQTIDPERGDYPSASGIQRIIACPGSRNAERGLPQLADKAVTADGDAIHNALETGETEALTETQEQIAARLKGLEMTALNDWMRDNGIEFTPERHAEERLWIRDQSLNLVASAKLDVFYIDNESSSALLLDFKSGFKKVAPSESNWQLRTQTIALFNEFPGILNIRVGIAASRLSSSLDLAEYDIPTILDAKRLLIRHIQAADAADAPRVPSANACQYCRAKSFCPQAASYAMVTLAEYPPSKPNKLSVLEAVNRLTPLQVSIVYRRSKLAYMIFEAIEDRLKAMPVEDLNAIGLDLKPGSTSRSIKDIPMAINALSAHVKLPQLLELVSMPLGKVTKLLASSLGISQKAADAQVEEILAGNIETTQNKPSLIELV